MPGCAGKTCPVAFKAEAFKKSLVDRLKAGDVVGELAVFISADRSATIIAETDSEVYIRQMLTFGHMLTFIC